MRSCLLALVRAGKLKMTLEDLERKHFIFVSTRGACVSCDIDIPAADSKVSEIVEWQRTIHSSHGKTLASNVSGSVEKLQESASKLESFVQFLLKEKEDLVVGSILAVGLTARKIVKKVNLDLDIFSVGHPTSALYAADAALQDGTCLPYFLFLVIPLSLFLFLSRLFRRRTSNYARILMHLSMCRSMELERTQ